MKKLIITADDYGMSKAVNKAIDAGIASGLITSTNVMTNMPFYQEAKKLQDNKTISVGMHWVLTCGRPVLPVREIPSLVTSDGEFYSYHEFRKRYREHLVDDNEIKKELIAQYNLYREEIGIPDYWNTHENFHVDYGIYQKMVQLAKELDFTRMRSHQRIYIPGSRKEELRSLRWRMMEPIKAKIIDSWQNNAHKVGMNSPEGRIVFMGLEDAERPEYAFSHIQWKKHSLGEYVIHPATEADSPYFGEIVERRILEYQIFTSDETRKRINDANIILVNYDECDKMKKK